MQVLSFNYSTISNKAEQGRWSKHTILGDARESLVSTGLLLFVVELVHKTLTLHLVRKFLLIFTHTNTHKATTCVLHGRHYWLCMSLWVAPISIHVHKKMRVAYSVTLTSFHSSFHVHTELRELPGMLLMFPLFFNMGVMSQWSIECHAFWYKFHIPIYIGFKI